MFADVIELYNLGLEWLKGLVDRHGINCGWSAVGKYHAAATGDGERRLHDNLAHYRAWGIPYREFDQAELHRQLGTLYYRYGYHSDNNVFVQPAALVRGSHRLCRRTFMCGKTSRLYHCSAASLSRSSPPLVRSGLIVS